MMCRSAVPGFAAPKSMTVAGSTLYFSATTLEYGAELWKSDGTAAGTSLVADLRFGPLGSYPSGLTAFGTGLAFIAGDDDGTWLSITRGTAATTTKIAAASSSDVTRAVVLDPSANVRVKYLGDSFYQPVAKIVPLLPARTRAAH